MATWLRGLKLTRIDLVDRGANPGAAVTLFKRDDTPREVDDVAQPELEARIAQLEAENADLQKRVEELTPPQPEADPITKADPAVREMIAKAQEDAREAREQVAKLEQERDAATFVAKAAEFPHMGTAESVGPVLQKIAQALAPEEWEAFERQLRATEELVKQSVLLKEAGHDADLDADPYERFRKMAIEQHPEAANAHDAVAKFMATPDGARRYREYLETQKGQ
jgi:cytochrome c551/c552